jgi:hypothetical protein
MQYESQALSPSNGQSAILHHEKTSDLINTDLCDYFTADKDKYKKEKGK